MFCIGLSLSLFACSTAENTEADGTDTDIQTENEASQDGETQDSENQPDGEETDNTAVAKEAVAEYLSKEIVHYTMTNNVVYLDLYPPESELPEEDSKAALTALCKVLGCEDSDVNFCGADRYAIYAVYGDTLYRYLIAEGGCDALYTEERLFSAHIYSNLHIILLTHTQQYMDYAKEIEETGQSTMFGLQTEDITFYGTEFEPFKRLDVLTGETAILEGRNNPVGNPFSKVDPQYEGNIEILGVSEEVVGYLVPELADAIPAGGITAVTSLAENGFFFAGLLLYGNGDYLDTSEVGVEADEKTYFKAVGGYSDYAAWTEKLNSTYTPEAVSGLLENGVYTVIDGTLYAAVIQGAKLERIEYTVTSANETEIKLRVTYFTGEGGESSDMLLRLTDEKWLITEDCLTKK